MAKKKREGEMSKSDAVRAALAEGITLPSEGVAYIREKYGIEVAAQNFSSVKLQEKKKGGKKPKGGVDPVGIKSAARVTASANGAVDLARQVKSLVEQYGAATVKEMVDLFAG